MSPDVQTLSEGTKVRLSAKTLVWIISIVFMASASVLGTLYSIKEDVEETRKQLGQAWSNDKPMIEGRIDDVEKDFDNLQGSVKELIQSQNSLTTETRVLGTKVEMLVDSVELSINNN